MYLSPDLEIRSAAWRFHSPAEDGLLQPIPFAFVTERMCAEILAERERILSVTPPARRHRQGRLFGRYDPQRRAELFKSMLRPFAAESAEPQAA